MGDSVTPKTTKKAGEMRVWVRCARGVQVAYFTLHHTGCTLESPSTWAKRVPRIRPAGCRSRFAPCMPGRCGACRLAWGLSVAGLWFLQRFGGWLVVSAASWSSTSERTPTFPLSSLGSRICSLSISRQAILKASNDGKACCQFEGRRSFPSLRSLYTLRIRFLYVESKGIYWQLHKCNCVQTVQYTTCTHVCTKRNITIITLFLTI